MPESTHKQNILSQANLWYIVVRTHYAFKTPKWADQILQQLLKQQLNAIWGQHTACPCPIPAFSASEQGQGLKVWSIFHKLSYKISLLTSWKARFSKQKTGIKFNIMHFWQKTAKYSHPPCEVSFLSMLIYKLSWQYHILVILQNLQQILLHSQYVI